MAGSTKISGIFHEDDFLVVPHRTTADLPPHVLGTARWNSNWYRYYVPKAFTSTKQAEPVEFLNNRWYLLYTDPAQPGTFHTRASALIAVTNDFGLGYWDPSDPLHPDFQPTAAIDADPPSPSHNAPTLPSTSTTHQTSTILPVATGHVNPKPTAPTIPLVQPATMSAGATGTAPTTAPPATAPTSNGGLRGVPPTIFNGDRSKADTFWSEFRRYALNNRSHPAMTLPFDRVLTALSYIRGPLVDDWVNAQETHLTTRTDTTQTTFVLETDPVLWTEFATAFQDGWKDTSKKQNAHEQLRKLTMKGWDIDTYIASFERLALAANWALALAANWALALAANWALAAEGTIMQFRQGLNKMIHSRTLDRDKIPDTFNEWKAAARTEVACAKEKYNMGLIGPHPRPNQHQQRDYSTPQHRTSSNQNPNPQHVPMDVDAATTTKFQKLTPEERDQLAKEGCCFRCRLQGHLARNCPKNTTPPVKVRAATSSPNETTPTPDLEPIPPPKEDKLTRAQE